ncbi:lariat debranching enzyme, partial [Gnomoniopsis sp. IMI 355080]
MAEAPNPTLLTREGVRVAIEGCGHGALNPIYAAVHSACQARGWPGVDLLIICGDFQSTRNGHDVEVMSVPAKYRVLGDFHEYYSGAKTAPYLTIFIAGNHEAAAYLWELYYGGWVAPNIYYMGAANVLRVGPLRIAGLSGIWKGFDYRKAHGERLPFGQGDVKSFYHVREFDVRKLLQIREQVDVGLSHDWPRGVEKHGDVQQLYRLRPMWKEESLDGSLGSVAAEHVMNRLRPAYWFSAHMHWKYSAVKSYPPPGKVKEVKEPGQVPQPDGAAGTALAPAVQAVIDPNEIDLDMDDEDEPAPAEETTNTNAQEDPVDAPSTTVSDDLRAQLPASFLKPKETGPKGTPGQPVPPTITNTEVRFLALNKCEPRRDFLQVCDLHPVDQSHLDKYTPSSTVDDPNTRYPLQYDPEWLAITRVFHPHLTIGDRTAPVPADEGEATYLPLIKQERAWVEANIVAKGKLDVPHNFSLTAPALTPESQETHPDLWSLHSGIQPREYTNPQTAAFCEMMELPNLWDATEEEREARRQAGPPAEEDGG